MGTLYAIAVFVFVITTGITLILTIREAIEQERIFRFFVWLIAFMLSVGVLIYSVDMMCKDSNKAISNCNELGYQSTEYYNDSWYCVTYGNEPKIIKLEGVE